MIMGLATPRSLVLVDELGRGTSPTEGVGISHAIAETLIDSKVWYALGKHANLVLTVVPVLCFLCDVGLFRHRAQTDSELFSATFTNFQRRFLGDQVWSSTSWPSLRPYRILKGTSLHLSVNVGCISLWYLLLRDRI
jgi:hypothetical protein